MASKTLNKDTLRLINSTKSRFFSLIAIVTLGMAFFVGVSASSRIMDHSVDVYDDQTNLKDITIYSNFGFEDEDVKAVASLPDVAAAESSKFVDVIATAGDTSEVARIHSYDPSSTISQFILREGRLPENDHEILGEGGTGMEPGLAIGTTVTFSRPDNDLNDYLSVDQATIVGWIDTPVYLNMTKENSTLSNQYIKTYFYIPKTSFTIKYDLQIDVVTKDGKSYDAFSDDYANYDAKVKDEIEELAVNQSDRLRNRIYDDAMKEYNDGMQEYLDGVDEYNTKIADAEKKLNDSQNEVNNGEKELTEGIQKLKDSEADLESGRSSGAKQIADARNQLAEGQKTLDTQKTQFEAQKLQLQSQISTIDTALSDLRPAYTALSNFSYDNLNMGSFLQMLPSSATVNPGSMTQESVKALMAQLNITDQNSLGEFRAALSQQIHLLEAQGISETDPTLSGLKAMDFALSSLSIRDMQLSLLMNILPDTATEAMPLSKSTLQDLMDSLSLKSDDTFGHLLDSLSAQISSLEKARAQILSGIQDGENQISSAQQKIDSGYEKINIAENQMNAEFVSAQEKILNGWAEIADNKQKLEEAKKEISDGWIELEKEKTDGYQKLEDAKADLDKAKQDIDSIDQGEWTVLDRTQHYASRTYRDTIHQMAAIASIFPMFFFLVAALVCLTTMTRMVDEQRGQLGILRALGYTRLQCASKYLVYAGTATLVGTIAGTIIGLLTFPSIIYNAWSMMYIHPKMLLFIPWDIVLESGLGFLIVMMLTTWNACSSDMREVPSQLMRPKPPKLGKKTLLEKITPVWSRMSFTWKVTARNLIRYKKRFVMTVFGVAGCTALLITGFGIKDSVNSIVDIQFKEIQLYDGSAHLKDDQSVSDVKNFADQLVSDGEADIAITAGSYTAKAYNKSKENDETVYTQIFSSADDVKELYCLRTRVGHKSISISDDGVIINEKLAENLGLSVGDQFYLESDAGVLKMVKVAGITEIYVQHYVLMTENYYEAVFSTSKKMDTVMIKAANGQLNSLKEKLTNDEKVSDVTFYDDILNNFKKMVKSLDLIVWVLILCSMGLAFIVLGNLTNINISERQREIATLKVLGFRRKEVQSYIYKENVVLTFLGSLVGMPVGTVLHHWIMRQVEMDYIIFGRTILPSNYLISIAMTIGFGIIVNYLMAGKLKRIEMVESLKSVE